MKKLYETQSYLKECEALITDYFCEGGRHYIALNQSVFFPEEGGQYADTGAIKIIDGPDADAMINLLDGQIVKNGEHKGEIIYEVAAAVKKGSRVQCYLDWDKRFDRMQNHSGEHVLTGLIHNKYGFNNVGFHLSDDSFVTLDFDGSLTYEQVMEMEREANGIIYKNLPVKDSYPSKEELSLIEYRSKIEIEGQVRLITIGTPEDGVVDVCACCAPHVLTTAEIGLIKVISVIKWKKGVQVAILCGRRALEYVDAEHDTLTNIARNLSTSPENVWNVVKSHLDEIADLKARLSEVMEKQLIDEVNAIEDGQPQLIFTEHDLTAINMKNVYNALVNRFTSGVVAVFVGDDESGYRYNAGIIGDDARVLATKMRDELNAKGGGSPEMIQGRVSAKCSIIKEILK